MNVTVETAFCYEIHADAGLGQDTVTGENAKAYVKVAITFREQPSEQEYKMLHEQEILKRLSSDLSINENHFTPISLTEYFDNHIDEDE